MLLIFCRVNDFADSLYRVNHFEQEIDLIKRIGSNKLYLQVKNVLDDFLGVRKVKEYIDFVANLKQPSQTTQTGNNADRSASIDDTLKQTAIDSKVVSPPADVAAVKQPEAALPEIESKYREYSEALNEFRIRHNVIIDEIDRVNEVNKKLLDELEQYVILGFLDRQEQHILYEKYAGLCQSLKQSPDAIKLSTASIKSNGPKIGSDDIQRIIDLSKEFSTESKGKSLSS